MVYKRIHSLLHEGIDALAIISFLVLLGSPQLWTCLWRELGALHTRSRSGQYRPPGHHPRATGRYAAQASADTRDRPCLRGEK